MRDDPLLGMIVLMVIALGGFAIWSGLTWLGAQPPHLEVVTARGETVLLFGQGAYRLNPEFMALAFRAQDWVMLVALAMAGWSVVAMRGPRGFAVLLLALGYIFYGYSTLAFAAELDWLMPVHAAIFTLTLFALWRAGSDARAGFERITLPRGPVVAYLLLAGLGTAAAWGPPLLSDLSVGQEGQFFDTRTTQAGHVLRLALLMPLCLVAAGLVLRRNALGHVIALPLIGCLLLLFPARIAATVFQAQAGIEFTVAEWVGPIVGFAVIGLLAVWVLRLYLVALRQAPVMAATPEAA
ncbi:hypothetical protein CCR87_01625 [Rhodobaculum claviforme]|uniref:Uncharacterized protein n=1 Tax=Rhodobaculum claviforme TaxID=1549854 RepID=A0A934TIE1_9RHOB|nr:hypothetical protein [Rhodobaculum claviforme]